MRLLSILLLFGVCALANAAEAPLFHANSRQLGYDADLDVTEVTRLDRASELNIRGFHSRSAFGSRWLMCSYTTIAMQRQFRNWVAYYPESPDETLVLIFPDSPNDDLSKLAGREVNKARLVPSPPLEKMLAFCSQVLKDDHWPNPAMHADLARKDARGR